MTTILVHHGIEGQRWGVRRYQNEDGSLTSEGKKRLLEESGAAIRTGKTLESLNKIATGPKSKTVRKDYSKLTDAELQKRVNRLNLEENYGRLTGDTKKVRSGGDWTRELLQSTGIIVSTLGSAVAIYATLKKVKGG